MSRHPRISFTAKPSLAEECIHFIFAQARPPAVPFEAIIKATATDATLQDVTRSIRTNWWGQVEKPNSNRFLDIKELTSFGEISHSALGIARSPEAAEKPVLFWDGGHGAKIIKQRSCFGRRHLIKDARLPLQPFGWEPQAARRGPRG
ncbi:hypothetical protein NDU88_001088 [Pleurodeles waltl]|uniref:Uncharacterized protein n=1 Tax=Pleurodeles waltl TaxID=8319 RepID=A0AAV7U638_PLEWA|nr:hypothetical protein NDU88_001088 [Pleurodeles waltl]